MRQISYVLLMIFAIYHENNFNATGITVTRGRERAESDSRAPSGRNNHDLTHWGVLHIK